MPSSSTHRHPLLQGSRWRLARSRSRALWTSATPAELSDLCNNPRLRRGVEDFLRRVADVVDDVGTLLVFDQDCSQLAVVIGLPSPERSGCAWNWAYDTRAPAG